MRLFVSTDFEGFYPVGTAAVITANSAEEAAVLLRAELETAGLPQSHFTVAELSLAVPSARILCDGNY